MSDDFTWLSEAFDRSVNEDGTFNDNVNELTIRLYDADRLSFLEYDSAGTLFSQYGSLLSRFTSDGIPFYLGNEQVRIDHNSVIGSRCQDIPTDISLGLHKMIVRLIRDFIDSLTANEEDADGGLAYSELCSDGSRTLNDFAKRYPGHLDYCVEYRDKVRQFLVFKGFASYRPSTYNSTLIYEPLTDESSLVMPEVPKFYPPGSLKYSASASKNSITYRSATKKTKNLETIDDNLRANQNLTALKYSLDNFYNEMRARITETEAYYSKERKQ